MNQKKAKRLRNAARLLTVGMPERQYQYREHIRYRLGDIDPQTGEAKHIPYHVDEVSLTNTCTRAAYQQMKKEMA